MTHIMSDEVHSGDGHYTPDIFCVLRLVYGMLCSDSEESSDGSL